MDPHIHLSYPSPMGGYGSCVGQATHTYAPMHAVERSAIGRPRWLVLSTGQTMALDADESVVIDAGGQWASIVEAQGHTVLTGPLAYARIDPHDPGTRDDLHSMRDAERRRPLQQAKIESLILASIIGCMAITAITTGLAPMATSWGWAPTSHLAIALMGAVAVGLPTADIAYRRKRRALSRTTTR